jgi:hypothetical protein
VHATFKGHPHLNQQENNDKSDEPYWDSNRGRARVTILSMEPKLHRKTKPLGHENIGRGKDRTKRTLRLILVDIEREPR